MKDRIHWLAPPERLALTDGCVHVWLADLDLLADRVASFLASLSPEEQNRANRFRLELARSRFVVARGILRGLLAKYMDRPSGEIEIETNTFGKPFVKGDLGFNLSHSSSLAVFAFIRNGDIGVDVEQIRADVEYLDIARDNFDEQTFQALQVASKERQLEEFFWQWTSKEALVKAMGKGLAEATRIEMDLLTQPPSHQAARSAPKWRLYRFAPEGNFVAAIACSVTAQDFKWWRISSPADACDSIL